MRKFKAGEYVKCKDSTNIDGLELDEVYEIEYLVRGINWGEYFIHLKDVQAPFALHPDRFIYPWEDTKLGKLL